MLKYIKLGSHFQNTNEPTIQFLDASEELMKVASDNKVACDTSSGIVKKFREEITPRENCVYLLVIAMGAYEVWGPNNNGDAFKHEELLRTHPRFTKEACIFVEHRNKNVDIRLGKPVLSVYNHKMWRVELVLEVDFIQAKKNRDVDAIKFIADIKEGKFPELSMGTHVKYDVCSICGNHARTKRDHCYHIKFELKNNPYHRDGKRVCMFNPDPHFFDLSFVARGADRTAKSLEKLASEDDYLFESEIEKVAKLNELKAEFEKKADLIKKIKGITLGSIKGEAADKARFYLSKVLGPSIENHYRRNLPVAEQIEQELNQETDPINKVRIIVRVRKAGYNPLLNKQKNMDEMLGEIQSVIDSIKSSLTNTDKGKDEAMTDALSLLEKNAQEDRVEFDPEQALKNPKVRTRYSNLDVEGNTINLNKSLQMKAIKKPGTRNIFTPLLTGAVGGSVTPFKSKGGRVGSAALAMMLANYANKKWFTPSKEHINKNNMYTLSENEMSPVPENRYHPFIKQSSLVDTVINEHEFLKDLLVNIVAK